MLTEQLQQQEGTNATTEYDTQYQEVDPDYECSVRMAVMYELFKVDLARAGFTFYMDGQTPTLLFKPSEDVDVEEAARIAERYITRKNLGCNVVWQSERRDEKQPGGEMVIENHVVSRTHPQEAYSTTSGNPPAQLSGDPSYSGGGGYPLYSDDDDGSESTNSSTQDSPTTIPPQGQDRPTKSTNEAGVASAASEDTGAEGRVDKERARARTD